MMIIVLNRISKVHITLALTLLVTSSHAQFFNSVDLNGAVSWGTRDMSGNQYYITSDKIVKVSSTNQTILWSKKLNVSYAFGINVIGADAGNNIISKTFDNGAPHGSTIVRKISSAGNFVWKERLSANTNLYLGPSLISKDNSVYLGGGDCAFQNGIIKLNSSGNLVWAKAFEDFNLRGGIAAIKEKKNGNLLVVARNLDANSVSVISIFEIDTAGVLLWNKFYQLSGNWNGTFGSVCTNLTSKNEIIFSINPMEISAPFSPIIFKTDSNGTLNWSKRYSVAGGKPTRMTAFEIDPYDNIISTNEYDVMGGGAFALVRFRSSNGIPINASSSDSIAFYGISALSPNDYISSGFIANNGDGILAKTDSLFSGVCSFTPITASSVNYSITAVQYNLSPYNLSITVAPVSETLIAASLNRHEACKPNPVHTSLSEILLEKVHIFPNPTSTELFIETQEPCDLKLINQLSQLVFMTQLKIGRNRIETNDLPKGMYFLYCKRNDGTQQINRLVIE